MIRLHAHNRRCVAVFGCCLLALILVFSVSVDASDLRRSAIVKAVELASPAVVNIHGRKTVRERVAGRHSQPSERFVNGMGTGIVFDDRGYILTNYHVVQGVAAIVVTQHDQTTHTARLITHDITSDLAIIKIDVNQPMQVVLTGDSSTLMPGETVIAVGNAYGYKHTVTRGIVSALNRDVQINETQRYKNLIQTDASINPGNSGGPLLNINGEMIGVNVAVRIGAQGIGFAIPSNDALEIAGRLLAKSRPHGALGLEAKTEYSLGGSRYVVQRVFGPAASAERSIRPGDVIARVGTTSIRSRLDYERSLLQSHRNDAVTVHFRRDQEAFTVKLPLSPRASIPTATTDQIWSAFGVRLRPVSKPRLGTHQKRYRGGLQVVDVRQGSLADRNGIRSTDVLLGIHKWETISLDNLVYILSSPEYQNKDGLKFYLLRNQQVLYGKLSIPTGS